VTAAVAVNEGGPPVVDQLLTVEQEVWAALAAGDADADTRLLADDFLGVYSSGFAGKADHCGQLADGPTVAAYELSEARVLELAADVVLLAYRARWVGAGARGTGTATTMYVSSVWRRTEAGWRNVFSQDTPAEA
jgi:hypothetical protein